MKLLRWLMAVMTSSVVTSGGQGVMTPSEAAIALPTASLLDKHAGVSAERFYGEEAEAILPSIY